MLHSESSCLESLALRRGKGKPAVYDLQSSQWEVEHTCVLVAAGWVQVQHSKAPIQAFLGWRPIWFFTPSST